MHERTLRPVLQLQQLCLDIYKLQLRLDVHKLQLRSWKILVAAAAAHPLGILHKKSRSQLQKFVRFSNVKTLDKIEIL
jgi:hypothetical protein